MHTCRPADGCKARVCSCEAVEEPCCLIPGGGSASLRSAQLRSDLAALKVTAVTVLSGVELIDLEVDGAAGSRGG